MQVPCEVPLGPRVFVNRLTESARLDEVISADGAGRVSVTVCTGLPGVGKTALVRRFVQRVRDDGGFPDGDLHVDFGATGDGHPVSVADALASCLTAMGVSRDVLPSSLAGRANLLRSTTAGRKMVIVLDDVTDAAQVLPFVPRTPGNAVLVTSSNLLNELELDGAEPIRLEPLDKADAAQLMTVLCGPRVAAESAAFAELVERCAGLPVALRVVAARLAARPRLRIVDLVDQIGDESVGLMPFAARGMEKVVAVFAVSYRALGSSAARLYRLLGVFPAREVTVEVLAVLAGSDSTVLADDIDELIESGLVTEDAAGRLGLHPLVRRHAVHVAREQDTDDQHRAALRRVVKFLLVRACFADRAVLGPGRYRVDPNPTVLLGAADPFAEQGAQTALGWLDGERFTLLAVLRAAFAQGWNEQVWQLAEAMTALYIHRRYLVDWTESSAIGADAAGLVADARAEARLRSFVSRPWTDLGDLTSAGRELQRALQLAHAAGDVRLLASVWEMFGRYYDETDAGRAPEAYRRAITLFRGQQDARGVAFTSYFLGCSQLRDGDVDGAIDTIGNALPGIRADRDQRMEGRALTTLGEALMRRSDLPGARGALESAIAVLRQAGTPFYEAGAQEKWADLALLLDDRASVRAALSRAAELYAGLGSPKAAEIRRRLRDLDDPPPA
jgi:tetratricopeptide (TPR) repeat protein